MELSRKHGGNVAFVLTANVIQADLEAVLKEDNILYSAISSESSEYIRQARKTVLHLTHHMNMIGQTITRHSSFIPSVKH